jgi:signal transduction histidine kinase
VVAIRDDHEALLGAALVLSDVTKFHLLDQLKSDMVSTVSHELKTPLTSVQMAIHLLLEEAVGPLNAKQIELLLAARQDSDRLLAMVNDMLDLTRIEQGRLRLELVPVRPNELMAQAAERFEARARDAGIAIRTSGEIDLPPVMADHERIGHVFDNLINNALQHTDRGGSISLAAQKHDGMIRFTIEDNGEGIASEHLPRIFEKFYRVSSARHPGGAGGAGLGLAIAHEIVAGHAGQIQVTSRLGAGTTFAFTLPMAPQKDGPK